MLIINLSFLLIITITGISATRFTFVNKCQYTVWPGILANAGTPPLETTGFELPTDSSRTFQAPTGWSGRFWGRTGCKFSSPTEGFCATGDCGSGQVECNGAGAAPPATLAEFTLGSGGGQDFYDVSLVDGYNVAMLVEVNGGGDVSNPGSDSSNSCATTGCVQDLNRFCPTELRVGDGEACKSACEAFGRPDYCCSGEFGNPDTCKPSVYSEMFKRACPRSYSYAYDDASSTFTCSNADDYIITFCPSSSTSSQKSTDIPTTPPATPFAATTTTPDVPAGSNVPVNGGSGSPVGSNVPVNGGSGSAVSYGAASEAGVGSASEAAGSSGSGTGSDHAALLAEGSWLAGLAMGDSIRTVIIPSPLQIVGVTALSLLCYLLYL